MQITDKEAFRAVWSWIVDHDGETSLVAARNGLPDVLVLHDEDEDEREYESRAYLGDWVLRHEDGRFTVMSPDEFARRYEPLPESATAPPTGETMATNQP